MLGKGGENALADMLAHLPPSAPLLAPLMQTLAFLNAAPPRQREVAALPFLRLFGLVLADGALRRMAHPLAAWHGEEAVALAALLAARCRGGHALRSRGGNPPPPLE